MLPIIYWGCTAKVAENTCNVFVQDSISWYSTKNITTMEKCLILGCGPSLSKINGAGLTDIVTVGVNDCAKSGYIPDYLMVVDNDFSPERRKIIDSCAYKSILVSHIPECFSFKNKIGIELGEFGSLSNLNVGGMIDYSRTSTYMAIIFAYKYLHAKKIGMLGVDFTNNYGVDLELSRQHYGNLYRELKTFGCELYNLSEISIIDTVEKLDFDKF